MVGWVDGSAHKGDTTPAVGFGFKETCVGCSFSTGIKTAGNNLENGYILLGSSCVHDYFIE